MHCKKISKKSLILFLLIFAFFEPTCISDLANMHGGAIRWFHYFIALLRYLGIMGLTAICILNRKKISKFTKFILVIEFIYLFVCFVNEKSRIGSPEIAAALMATTLSGGVDIFDKEQSNKVCNVLLATLATLIIINFISVIIFPKGMYIDTVRDFKDNYFLGFKNQHIYYFFSYIAFSFRKLFMEKRKKEFICFNFFMYIIMFLSVVISKATTAMISLGVIIISMFLFKRKKPLNSIWALVISMGISFVLIASPFQNPIATTLDAYFDKDGSLMHRTSIWKTALFGIAQSPFWGNGNIDIPVNWTWDVGQCHNKYLDLLFVGGIIYFTCFVVMLVIVCHNADTISKYTKFHQFVYLLYGYLIVYILEAKRIDFLSTIAFSLICNTKTKLERMEYIKSGYKLKYKGGEKTIK